MLPYVIKCKDIDNKHLEVFRMVVNVVRSMNDKGLTQPGLTCHEVCENLMAVSPIAESLIHLRGRFGDPGLAGRGRFVHSWLEFKEGKRTIIDPYPVGCASGPLLLHAEIYSPWYWLYVPDEDRAKTFVLLSSYTALYSEDRVKADTLLHENRDNIWLQILAMRARMALSSEPSKDDTWNNLTD